MLILFQLWEDMKMALTAIFTNKLRSILTTLGIIIGVMAVIAIVSIVNGMNRLFVDELLNLGGDVFMVQKMDIIITSNDQFRENMKRPDIRSDDLKNLIEACPAVSYISPNVYNFKRIKYNEKTSQPLMVRGTDLFQQYMKSQNVIAGRYLSFSDNTHARLVCVLGFDVAENMFPSEDPVGKTVKLGSWKMTVIGVMEKQGDMFGQSLDNYVIVPLKSFLKIYGFRRSLEVSIKAKEGRFDEAQDQVIGYFRRIRRVPYSDSNNFTVTTNENLINVYKQTTAVAYAVMIGVAAISLVVGGIGIMNVMLVSVKERTREIGIRKALGAKQLNILWQFLIEAVTLCLIGGGIGLTIGILIALLVRTNTPLPAAIPLWTYGVGFGIPCAVGVTFGVVPAYKASQLDPIDALRYE
ncbi:MAG: hypothetical protein B6244_14210 [Candidatus Cloacimonetes bacterium 4572_55]|nr:MAG: hypothetical protein B6244_14210 [Candidatus Cloacimonetes bacterium 4572_55]